MHMASVMREYIWWSGIISESTDCQNVILSTLSEGGGEPLIWCRGKEKYLAEYTETQFEQRLLRIISETCK